MKNFFAIAFLFLWTISAQAQTEPPVVQEPEDIAAVTDEFQDHFYESLKQKGIENYDRAISELEKCLKIQPNNPTLFFELGKNYLFQKDYRRAYQNFEKATQLDPKNQWAWVGLYDVSYETGNFNQAIVIVQKLVEFKKEYREELASLYMSTMQFDKALDLINELNETVGKSEMRDNYKAQILRDAKYQGPEKANLLAQIAKNPKEESNYISLIYLYSESNQEEKAMEIAKKLEREIPESEWAQVSLFKFNLANNDIPKAIKSMNVVLSSKKIDSKIKHRVLNEFLILAKDKPEYDADLEKAIGLMSNDREVAVAKEIAKFYHGKNKWDQAAKYYEMHLKSAPEDIETILLYFDVLGQKGSYEPMAKKAGELMELFPLQPQFYYYAGLAQNQLKNHKKALDMLQAGLDFVVDDPQAEARFHIQIGEAYHALGDGRNKEIHFKKAEALLKKSK